MTNGFTVDLSFARGLFVLGTEDIRKENMDMNKTGKPPPKEDKSLVILREMPKDHPFYKRGFIIGERYTKRPSKATEKVIPKDRN